MQIIGDNRGGSFLRELKRRRVVRTCIYYIFFICILRTCSAAFLL